MTSRPSWRPLVAAAALAAVLGTSPVALAQPAPHPRGVSTEFSISVAPGRTDVLTDSPVTVTVSARDANDDPIPGLLVDFTRSSSTESPTVTTDLDGTAPYVFQPTDAQCSTQDIVTAVVRDPDTQVVLTTLNVTISYLPCDSSVMLSGRSSRDGRLDVLAVTATTPDGAGPLEGLPVILRAKVDGAWQHVGPGGQTLNARGRVRIEVRDHNGNHVTAYRATIMRPERAVATNKIRLR